MESVLTTLNGVIWSPPLVIFCFGVGLFFTFRTGLVQVRGLPDFFRQIGAEKSSQSGISPFQSLLVSMGSRVGIGNIAGVATAIAFGGPGAVLWMWVMGFLGAATSFVECTLAQTFKEKDLDTGEYRGGPAFYISKAFLHTRFAPFFGLLAVVVSMAHAFSNVFFFPSVQANAVTDAMQNAWGIDMKITGVILALLLGSIIIGGVKRIAHFASVVVPFMAITYIVFALVIMILNFNDIPDVFGLIVSSGMGKEQVFGGMLGAAFAWGVKRGVYSNEAGMGNGAMLAGSAEVSHPAKQGFVQAVSVYVDTLLVCSATAFIIISTDMYHVFQGGAEGVGLVYSGNLAEGIAAGPGYVQAGVDSVIPGLGQSFVAIAILFFGFTSIVAFYYIAEANLVFLTRNIHSAQIRKAIKYIAQAVIVVAVIIGSFVTPGSTWVLGDIGIGMLAWVNLAFIVLAHRIVLKVLEDYRLQRNEGLDPQFDPEKLGIKNATFWEDRARGDSSADVSVNTERLEQKVKVPEE